MSLNANVLPSSGLIERGEQITALPQAGAYGYMQPFSLENFAREQIRGLVRRVFFTNTAQPVKQVVFSAAESHTDVGSICDQVGHALALETSADVAIVSRNASVTERDRAQADPGSPVVVAIKSWSTRMAVNLWRVPEIGLRELCQESATSRYWILSLAELRRHFEYVVIHGSAAGMSSESALLGQLTDGIILVLEARSTRRATARKIKETLEGTRSRILGTVLSERTFPEMIYRRL
jgi:hypothetical protein